MRVFRFLRFAVAWLLLLPIVMATADTVDGGRDGAFARVAHLYEGERYTYDVVVTSHAQALDLLVEDHITIEIGSVQTHQAEDGGLYEVLPITTTYRGSLSDLDALRDPDVDGTSTTRHLVDVASGRTVEQAETWKNVATVATDDGYEATIDQGVKHRFGPGSSPAFRWGMVPGQGISDPASTWLRSLGKLVSIEFPELERGTIDDVQVMNVQQWARNEPKVTHHALPGCSLQYPEVTYSGGPGLFQKLNGRAVWQHDQTRAWVSKERALPVMQECHNVLRLGGAGGTLVEEVRLATILSAHEAGGREVPIHFEPYDSLELRGPYASKTMETTLIGLPDDAGLDLPLGLDEALDMLRTSNDPVAKAWFAGHGDDAWVNSATYAYFAEPSDDREAFIEVPVPPIPVGPLAGDDEPVATFHATWRFDLQDDQAGALHADVHRTFDQYGAAMEDETDASAGSERPTWQAPTRSALVPLADLARRHADHFGLDLTQWLHTPGSGIEISKGPRSFTVAFPASQTHGNGTAYRADDGLRTSVWTYERSTQGANGPAGGPRMTTSRDADQLIPVVDRSTAAAAGAGALTALFILIYFWDLIYRFLVHVIGAPLYAKVHKDKALDNPRRQELHELVQGNPGITVAQIRQRLALGHGTALFHLATLEHVGLLSSLRVGRTRQWFVPGQMDHSAREQTAVLHHAAVRRVHAAIAADPGIHQRALADRLGIQPASLRPHLSRLESVGLISAMVDGRTKRYRARPAPAANPGGPEWRPVKTPA